MKDNQLQKNVEVRNFNKFIYNSNGSSDESSIKQMLQWLKDCDCAFISAYRSELKDIRDEKSTYLGPDNDWKAGKRFTREENHEKYWMLEAELLHLHYGVAKIKGACPEGMTDESSEESFLVVNYNDEEDFLDKMLCVAEYYNQDAIYIKEKGKAKGYLIGTNNCGCPGYHQKGEGSETTTDTASNYMLRLGNKAFSFVGEDAEEVNDWKEAVDFWRKMTDGGMCIVEEMHPVTKWAMGNYLRKMGGSSAVRRRQ